jgi:hypothetical protein
VKQSYRDAELDRKFGTDGHCGPLIGHGAERLVAALISRGLAPEHYRAAAALALPLDRDCARRRQEQPAA